MNMLKNSDAYIYTSLEAAKLEVCKRQDDKVLKERVMEYLGDIPSVFVKEPRAVLFRNIITPDHEFQNFIKLSDELNLVPLGLEYTADKFSTRNADKLCLAKMGIFQKYAKNGDAILHYKTILDIKANDNKSFREITTLHGEDLLDFHHNLLRKESDIEIYDLSEWILENGAKAEAYYKKVFAFFIINGVLIEDFVTNSSEAEFERRVTLPAFFHVWETFKVKPLIVKLLPDETDRYWWCYPPDII